MIAGLSGLSPYDAVAAAAVVAVEYGGEEEVD